MSNLNQRLEVIGIERFDCGSRKASCMSVLQVFFYVILADGISLLQTKDGGLKD